MRLLLGSGGISTPERMQAWKSAVAGFLGPIRKVLFIPYALADHDKYVQLLHDRGFLEGREILGIHRETNVLQAVAEAEAVLVGGGNTFRLLKQLYGAGLLKPIRERVLNGMPFMGVSAGTNIACPSIKTSNDMAIVQPPSFEALGLVPFQINPHYVPGKIHFMTEKGMEVYAGETRDDRLREFHEENTVPVLGLYEGSILQREANELRLTGPARLFRRGEPTADLTSGSEISSLLIQ